MIETAGTMAQRSLRELPTMFLIGMLLDYWALDLQDDSERPDIEDLVWELERRSGKKFGRNFYNWTMWFLKSDDISGELGELDRKFIVQKLKVSLAESTFLVHDFEKVLKEK